MSSTAIVTGGAGGIGSAVCRLLATQGWDVMVADLDERAARVTAESLDRPARWRRTDVSLEDDVRDLVAATLEVSGRLDLLVNTAALMGLGPDGPDTDLLSMTAQRWDGAFATTLRGPMLCCKFAIPAMLSQGGGGIVNVSSASSLRGDFTRIAYGSAKAGVNALTRHVATRYGKQGIRCNAVAPGLIRTPSVRSMPEVDLERYESVHLTPYLGEAEDVAGVIAFLASPQARFVTGQIIGVDGGELSHMMSSLRR